MDRLLQKYMFKKTHSPEWSSLFILEVHGTQHKPWLCNT